MARPPTTTSAPRRGPRSARRASPARPTSSRRCSPPRSRAATCAPGPPTTTSPSRKLRPTAAVNAEPQRAAGPSLAAVERGKGERAFSTGQDRASAGSRRQAGSQAATARRTTMTRNADFKRRVRERMARTGESYAAARAQLLPQTTLHVTNGDSTARTLAELGIDALPWRDALHEGPVGHGRRARAEAMGAPEAEFAARDRALETHQGDY